MAIMVDSFNSEMIKSTKFDTSVKDSSNDSSMITRSTTDSKFYAIFDENVVVDEETSFSSSNLQEIYDIPERFFCVICSNLLNKSCQMECGCRSCYECLKKLLDNNWTVCPNEDCKEITTTRLVRDKAFDKEMKEMEYKCLNRDCTASVPLLEFYEHRDICQFSFVTCRNCHENVQIKDKADHNLNGCFANSNEKACTSIMSLRTDLSLNYKTITNIYNFDQEVFADQIVENISDVKDRIETLRKYQNDFTNIIFDNEEQHEQLEKRLEAISKTYIDLDLKFQMTYLQNHLTMGYYDEYIWRISDFESKQQRMKMKNACLVSPSFYTNYRGYKMFLKLYPNGDGKGKDKFLSIYMSLIKGKYDPLLKWPFTKLVTFFILHPKNGKNKSWTMRPDLKPESFNRPKSVPKKATGEPCFLKLSSLEEYLGDQTLFVKVKIEN